VKVHRTRAVKVYRTRDVGILLRENWWTIYNLIRLKKMQAPRKDSDGNYLWFEDDVRRARAALATHRPNGRPRRHTPPV
jgi:hypothetical protein